MGRKCSVRGCKTGYDSQPNQPKIRVFTFPKDLHALQLWLRAFPTKLSTNNITDNMGICGLHWPEETEYTRRGRHLVPADPPSIFPVVDQLQDSDNDDPTDFLARPYVTADFIGMEETSSSSKSRSTKQEIEVDQEPEDVKPTLDVECNLVSDAASTDSTEEAVSRESTSFAAGSDNQYSNDGHPSPSPADLNPVLARSLQQASATTAPTRSPSLLTHTKRSMSQGSLDGETDGPASKGFKTFVVNMDSEWCSRSHSPPAPSPSPQQDHGESNGVETITTVKLEPGLDFADGLMEEEIQQHNQNGHNGIAASSDMEEESHFEITAKYVMSKLSLLSNKQRIYAEKLIADVLFEAEFGNLRSQSKLNVLGS